MGIWTYGALVAVVILRIKLRSAHCAGYSQHPWAEFWTNNRTQMELNNWHKLRSDDMTLNGTNPDSCCYLALLFSAMNTSKLRSMCCTSKSGAFGTAVLFAACVPPVLENTAPLLIYMTGFWHHNQESFNGKGPNASSSSSDYRLPVHTLGGMSHKWSTAQKK